MARFTTVSVARSDGRSHYSSNGYLLPNEPPRQDSTPLPDGSVDFYHRIQDDDPTSLDWKRKLGGMLMEIIGGPENTGKNYILAELPQDYVLWQHRRTKAKDGKLVADSSRQDTYLYGHPHGKCRFRSAQEFLPHLLWLATDPEGNSSLNCPCKYCFPDGKAAIPTDSITKPAPVVATATKAVEVPKALEAPVESVKTSVRYAASAQPANIPRPRSSPALNTKTSEQLLDSDPNNDFIYRPGELVWFNKGSAWGLSIILKRHSRGGRIRQFLVQPLSHPYNHPAPVVKDRGSIRPWLAWSVPSTTLKQINGYTYDQVPWDRVLRGDFNEPNRNNDPEVDASILAAKGINESYSFFDRVDVPTAPGEVHYKGMFLGGEKMWVGEPVRLMGDTKDEIVIMVVHQMIERTTDTNSSVTIVGDIYKFVKMPTPQQYLDRSNWPWNVDLPERVNNDLLFRNEIAAGVGTNIWREWRLLEPMARKTLADIKGRWYETRFLLPTLRGPEAFDLDMAAGEGADAGLFMNSRVDMLSGPPKRKRNRLATLGRAVPADLKISRGLDGPAEDNVFPDQV